MRTDQHRFFAPIIKDRGLTENVRKLQSALEAAGVVFIDEDGGGPGVQLRDRLKG